MKKTKDSPSALHHVLYEIEMLLYGLKMVRSPNVGSVWQDLSGRIEVFALHARNLNEFFVEKNEDGNRMKPHEFVPGWNYSHVVESEICRRLHNQISHLSHDREGPGEKTHWPIDQVFDPLRGQSSTFLKMVVLDETLMTYDRNREWTKELIVALGRTNRQLEEL